MSIVLVGGNVVKTRIVWYDGNQVGQVQNFFAVRSSPAPTATDQDVAVYMDSILALDCKAICAGDVEYIGVGAQILRPPQLYAEQTVRTNAGGCTYAGVSGAKQAASLAVYRTAFGGRGGRARNYFPFVPANAYTTNGELLPGYVVPVQLIATLLGGTWVITEGGRAATMDHISYNRKTGIYETTISATVGTRVANQLRRGDYRRTNPQPF